MIAITATSNFLPRHLSSGLVQVMLGSKTTATNHLSARLQHGYDAKISGDNGVHFL